MSGPYEVVYAGDEADGRRLVSALLDGAPIRVCATCSGGLCDSQIRQKLSIGTLETPSGDQELAILRASVGRTRNGSRYWRLQSATLQLESDRTLWRDLLASAIREISSPAVRESVVTGRRRAVVIGTPEQNLTNRHLWRNEVQTAGALAGWRADAYALEGHDQSDLITYLESKPEPISLVALKGFGHSGALGDAPSLGELVRIARNHLGRDDIQGRFLLEPHPQVSSELVATYIFERISA